MMNSTQPVLNHYLPLTPVAIQSLLKLLDRVALEQKRASDRLTLAFPFDEILAYFESKTLRDVKVIEQGLINCIANPLAAKEPVVKNF